VATLQESILGRLQKYNFEVEIDGVRAPQDDMNSILVMIFNGKFTGGGMIVDPFACMNDGLMDIVVLKDPKVQNLTGVADMLDKAKKKGGVHVYDRKIQLSRCKRIVMKFKGVEGRTYDPKNGGWGVQSIGIDGELLSYKDKITYEVCPDNVEYAFDSAKFYKDHEMLVWYTA